MVCSKGQRLKVRRKFRLKTHEQCFGPWSFECKLECKPDFPPDPSLQRLLLAPGIFSMTEYISSLRHGPSSCDVCPRFDLEDQRGNGDLQRGRPGTNATREWNLACPTARNRLKGL